MTKHHNRVKLCDKKFYGKDVRDCGNTIKGLDKILTKLEKEKPDEDKS